MALVKLDKGNYINPDYVISVFGDDTHCHIITAQMVMHTNFPGNPVASNVVKIDMGLEKVVDLLNQWRVTK